MLLLLHLPRPTSAPNTSARLRVPATVKWGVVGARVVWIIAKPKSALIVLGFIFVLGFTGVFYIKKRRRGACHPTARKPLPLTPSNTERSWGRFCACVCNTTEREEALKERDRGALAAEREKHRSGSRPPQKHPSPARCALSCIRGEWSMLHRQLVGDSEKHISCVSSLQVAAPLFSSALAMPATSRVDGALLQSRLSLAVHAWHSCI